MQGLWIEAVEHGNAADAARQRVHIAEMPGMRRIRHGGGVIGDGKRFVAHARRGCRHFVDSLERVGRAQGVGVQVCYNLHAILSSGYIFFVFIPARVQLAAKRAGHLI